MLALCGYREVRVFGQPGVTNAELDRAVIVAESDGWVESAVAQPCLAMAPPKRVLEATPRGEESAVSDAAIEARALDFVRGVFADVLRMPAADLSANANFERYGVDSLMVMELTDALKRHIGASSRHCCSSTPRSRRWQAISPGRTAARSLPCWLPKRALAVAPSRSSRSRSANRPAPWPAGPPRPIPGSP